MTTTSARPTACAGATAVIVFPFTTTTDVAATPTPRSAKATLAGLRSPVPEIVTAVPPLDEPAGGAIPLTAGAGFADNGKMHAPTALSIREEMTLTVWGWKTFVTPHPPSRWQ